MGLSQIINTVAAIINLGVNLTLFTTGGAFNPCFQERICAVQDLSYQEMNKYESNYEYSSEEWTPTFELKGEKNG